MADEGARQAYLKRLPAVVVLAEKRAVSQGRFVVSAGTFVTGIGLALVGVGKNQIGPYYNSIGTLLAILALFEFLSISVDLFRYAARRKHELSRLGWISLLMTAIALWLWVGLEKDVFVNSANSQIFAWGTLVAAAMVTMFVLLGVVYVLGRMFAPVKGK